MTSAPAGAVGGRTRKEAIWNADAQNTRPAPTVGTAAARVLLFGIAWLFRPFGRLRVGLPHYHSQGKFYGHTEYYLRLRKYRPPERREIHVLVCGPAVNRQILKMVGRQMRVIRSAWLWRTLDRVKQATYDDRIWIDFTKTGWLRGAEWSIPGPQLSFTAEEHARGQALLRRLGVPEGARHVCFFAKDRRYADNPLTPPDPNSYWGSRDFRNCDIKTYLAAADHLAKQGIWCFRMGVHEPEERLPDGLDPRIVDYTGRVRSTLDDPDFADAYLQATCKFFLGTTSGIYLLSSMFGVPVAYANMAPFGECGRMPHDIFIVKKCRERRTGHFIPYPALIARGLNADWLTLDELNKLDGEGIEFVDNTSDEILELVREMNQRLDRAWRPGADDDALMQQFRAIWPAKCFDGSEFPGRVGAAFLRENRGLLR